MAGVSNLRRLNHLHNHPPTLSAATASFSQQEGAELQEEDFYYQPSPFFDFDFDSFSPPNNPSISSFFDDYTASVGFGFDESSETGETDSEYEDRSCAFYGSEEDAEQMNFITDLFESRENHVTEDPNWELDSERVDDSGLEFGFGPGLRSNSGLRAVGMDSESDSDEFMLDSRYVSNEDENFNSFEISNDNYQSGNEREEFEWEEVSERNHFEEREILNSVIDRIEELSVASDISSSESENSRLGDDDEEEEEERNIEWEVLLAMNDLERNLELDNYMENIESEVPRVNLPEDYILAMEYDALFGQLVENENALKGSPPAAKSVRENLPSVVFTKDNIEENNCAVSCAVCMDEFLIGEKLTRMPCFHLYHGECILPWLRSRNTCPVCRYELPTDDAEYEKWRCERGRGRHAAHLDDIL